MLTYAAIGGGSTSLDPSEASDGANRARVVADAGATVGDSLYLSAKLEATVFGDALSRHLLAKSD